MGVQRKTVSDYHEESDYDEYNEMRDALESEGKEWRENYQRMKFKFRKL